MNYLVIEYFVALVCAFITADTPFFWIFIGLSLIIFFLYVFFKHKETHIDSWQNWLDTADFSNFNSVRYMSNYFQGKE